MLLLVDGLEEIAKTIRIAALVFLGLIILGIVLWILKVIFKIHRARKDRKLRKQLEKKA